MYNFATQDKIGKTIEQAFTSLLDAAGIQWAYNPATGTNDPSRADYDVIIAPGMLIEAKANPMAAITGNVALEEDVLSVSKAHYFLIAFPVENGWHGRVLHRYEIEKLLNATVYKPPRVYKYPRVPAGQYHRPSALIPTSDLTGVPVTEFLNQLRKAA